MTQNADQPVESPEDKDLQDHRFGMNAARMEDDAERSPDEREGGGGTEPHAGGRA